ncbi:MAG: ATP-binding cassette domain-containing protein, partial [Rickettsiales bacterium]|nr:ATP-binding cassette domain-containing protein [Rickettsiales bacterium]
MSYQYIYVMKDLTKAFPGGKKVLEGVYLSFFPGAKIGVLGPNGSGKSTLLKIMAGLDKEFNGEAWAADGVKIGYLQQEPKLDEKKNVMENIMDALGDKKALLDRFNEVSNKLGEVTDDDEMNKLIEEQGELQEKIEAVGGWDIEREIEIAMDALRCPPKDADVSKLSGGERRRVALTKLLLEKPDMLLLDEPTNHLDAESVAWLQHFLETYPGTVVMVTHDRYFLDNVAGWILELDRGHGIPYEGNYSTYLDAKRKRMEQEKSEETGRQKQLASELEWIRQGAKARQAKSKARIAAYEALQAQETKAQVGTATIVIPQPPRLGDTVIVADHLSKGFGDKLLIDDLSFSLPPGADKPDSGTFKVGDSVKLGYVDQSRDSLNDKNTVWEEISGGDEEIYLGKKLVKSRAYCSSFNFKGSDQQKKIGMLSGGERNRVHLAKMLRKEANVLLLDEPTNDLDVETLRALEEALSEFGGCAVII